MRPPSRRSPRTRLILTLAALASLIGGYYAGQYWQRRPLADLSAEVFPVGRSIDYPADLGIDDHPAPTADWRLFVTADTRAGRCRQLLRHYAAVINHLAPWPQIQERVRVLALAYDRPDTAAVTAFTGGVSWAGVVSAEPARLDRLALQLGIEPSSGDWCAGRRADAALVSPDHTAWALIPYEQADMMARNIRTIIAFVE